ncbi:MAG: winged helix-turn-helix transcriptional regulator [Pseudomonadota bacterium]|nr:winged helix-turn-helix transcriptional regulator [Pseudomonadota bacterium]MEE3098672.1 winged helix-turn-helix transcriptional regulator [Pseudomonadota bacterium]
MDNDALVKLASRAWSLAILAALDAGAPGRQAPLLAATGAGRTAFGASLAHLFDLGLMERNPGHGHPLRPEFRLTAAGRAAAPLAAAMLRAAPGAADAALLRLAWTAPVLAACRAPRFFGEIRADLSPITDRALSQTLTRLHAHRWIARDTDADLRPPRPRYMATGPGAEIGRAAARLRAA